MIGSPLLVLSAATAASAATVTTTTFDPCYGDITCSRYTAGTPPTTVTHVLGQPGEANRLTITREGEAWVIRDEGAPLSGCPAADATAVRCPVTAGDPSRGLMGLQVTLGDGDDQLNLAGGMAAAVNAGAGVDVVVGSASPESIDGGDGADRLDGGGGFDTLDFGTRTAGVVVDLGLGTTGEGDAIVGFERVHGGRGDDVLRGGPARDQLFGGAGRDELTGDAATDTLYGGDGADRLSGGAGDDRLHGGGGGDRLSDSAGSNLVRPGPGRDRVDVRNGTRDRVVCESGRDRILADRRDLLQRCSNASILNRVD